MRNCFIRSTTPQRLDPVPRVCRASYDEPAIPVGFCCPPGATRRRLSTCADRKTDVQTVRSAARHLPSVKNRPGDSSFPRSGLATHTTFGSLCLLYRFLARFVSVPDHTQRPESQPEPLIPF